MNVKNKIYDVVERKCPMCGRQTYLALSKEQAKEYLEYTIYSGLIQDKIPSVDKFGREFIKTGYCPKCQKLLFNATPENEDDYFYLDTDIRQNVCDKFIEQTGLLDPSESVQSEHVKALNIPEKLLYMYEFDMFIEDFFMDEKGNIARDENKWSRK